MNKREYGLTLKIDGDIKDIKGALDDLQKRFNTVEMPDKLTKGLEKDIENTLQKLGEFAKKSEQAINSMGDAKEVDKMWKNLSKDLVALQTKLENIDASKLFPKEVQDSLDKATAAAKKYTEALEAGKNSDVYKQKIEELNKVAELQRVNEGLHKKAVDKALQAEAVYNQRKAQWTDEVNAQYEEQQKAIADTSKAYEAQQTKVKELIALQKKLQEEGYLTTQKTVSSKKKDSAEQLSSAIQDEASKKTAQTSARRKVTNYENANKGKDLSKDDTYKKLVNERIKAEKEYQAAIARTAEIRNDAEKVKEASGIGDKIAEARAYENTLKQQAAAAKDAGADLEGLKKSIQTSKNAFQDASGEAKGFEKQLEKAAEDTERLTSELKDIQTNNAEKEWEELTQTLKEFTGVDLSQSKHDMEAFLAAIESYKAGEIEKLPETLKNIVSATKPIPQAMENIKQGVEGAADSAKQLSEAEKEMENLKNQVLQFFSIGSAVQLFKQAVSRAMNTIKELDATMTEAAVVTDFSVGDMWDKLPEYSAQAQKLGVSINGMYQATTLYYQQGLKTNEAMALGVETMKMAKIGGLESADATKAMTAALRGFNMELNETSATRVNDVYSELAAVTAADVSQISTAMEKTASIAASANMEFETTAALLAQIIETTQEAPETAGTAMKTIIARFSEVKSLREQGQTSGKDSEGEDIDVNKIQAALRTVGISMEGFFNGTEGLDDILLKLAEKWEGLDFETQRYIATMAAGSRQQSRFIAMMSDYSRTTELVSAANNSAGASQRQFNKTLDSMESKLQKLENAWNQFLMGLSNNTILKGAVDTLTFVVEGINKMTEALSGSNGLIKSVVSLTTVIGALKLGKSALGGVFGFVGTSMGFGSKSSGTSGDQPNAVQQMTGPNVQQQGEAEGQKAAMGFQAGWKRAMQAKKDGGGAWNTTKSFFSSDDIKDEKNARKVNNAERLGIAGIRKNAVKAAKKDGAGAGRTTAMESLRGRNSGQTKDIKVGGKTQTYKAPTLNDEQWDKVGQTYDEVYAKTNNVAMATEAASNKVREFGGTALDASEQETLLNEQTKTAGFDFKALGGAVAGAGAVLGGLSALFSELGMEEAAEATSKLSAVFVTLGTVMSIMPGIAKALGMSFTKAGVQISVAGWSGQLAWWWVILIVAAVALLVAGVIALAKAMEAASEEAQLEKMNEQIEALGSAAQDAKDKFDDLKSTFEELSDHQKTLKGLTKGTREWREALVKNNQAVLDLVNAYPELAQYMSRGENGELRISQEGQDLALDKQMEAYISAQNAQTALIQKRDEQQLAIDAEAKLGEATGTTGKMNYAETMGAARSNPLAGAGMVLGGAATGAAIGSILGPVGATIGGIIGASALFTAPTEQEVEQEQTGGLTHDEFTRLAAEMQNRGIDKTDKEGIEQLTKDMGIDFAEGYNIDTLMSSIDNLGADFDELANSAYALQLAEEARVDSIASSIAAVSDIVKNSEHARVAEEAGAQAFDDYDERVEEAAQKYTEQLDVKEDELETNETARKALQEYASSQDMTEAEVRTKVKNGELDKETIARILAAKDVDEEMKRAMESAVKMMERLSGKKSEKEINQLKSLMTDRGAGIDLGTKQLIDEKGIVQYIAEMGITDEDAKAMGYDSLEQYIVEMEQNYQRGVATFEKATEEFANMGIDISLISKNLSAGLAEDLANKTSMIIANFGEDAGKGFISTYNNIVSGLNPEQVETFTTYLSEVDWSDASQIEEFKTQLEELGMKIPESELDSLVSQMKEFGNATNELDFDQVNKKIRETQKLILDITTGEKERSFTDEEYKLIVEQLPEEKDNFVQDIDGTWYYVGNSMQDLVVALHNNTAALLGKTQAQMEAKAKVGEVLTSGNAYTLQSNDGEIKRDGLKNFLDTARAKGLSVADLGIAGLTDSTDVSLLSQDEVDRIANELLNIKANSAYYADQVKNTEGKASSSAVVAQFMGQGATTIGQQTGGDGFMYFDPEYMKEQIEYWAGVYGIDMSEYQEIYSEDPKVAQAATKELYDAFQGAIDREWGFENGFYDEQGNRRDATEEETEWMRGVLSSAVDNGEFGNDNLPNFSDPQEAFDEGIKMDEFLATDPSEWTNEQMSWAAKYFGQQKFKGRNIHNFMVGTSSPQLLPGTGGISATRPGLKHYAGDDSGATEDQKNAGVFDHTLSDKKELVEYKSSSESNITTEQAEALETLAARYGIFGKVLQDFRTAMEGTNKVQQKAAARALANEIELRKQEAIYGKTLKTLGNVYDKYTSVTKGMAGYETAINSYGEALGLGMEEGSGDFEFVEENLALIQQAAQGDIDAILELNRLLAAEHGLVITADGNFDMYNSAIRESDENAQEFIETQYKLGNYIVETVEVEQGAKYLAPKYDDEGNMIGFTTEDAKVAQTVQILKPKDAPSIERAQESGGAKTSSGGGGGGSKYKSSYDKLHNNLEEINDLLRERERLERRYQRLTTQGGATALKLAENSQKIIQSYKDEIEMQQRVKDERLKQIEEEMAKNSKLQKYVQVKTDEYGNKTIRIDWDEFEKLKDADFGEKADEYYDKMVGWLESIREAETTIEDDIDAIHEEMTKGMDEYLDLEDQVKEAIIDARQKEIDELSNINDSINDANSKLLDSMQQQIDEYRQARDNEKTEEELSDKQRKLAYLSQDTSGANALEILELQKEIEEGQESYTDQLIDQKISELQKQNDEASEQRQHQIELQEAMLKQYEDSGEVWKKVEELMTEGLNEDTGLVRGSTLETLLKSKDGWEAMSEIQQMKWLNDTNLLIGQALSWLGASDHVMASLFTGQTIKFKTADGEEISGEVQSDGKIKGADGHIYENVSWKGGDIFETSESTYTEPEPEPEPEIDKDAVARGIANSVWYAGGGWGTGGSRVSRIKEKGIDPDLVQKYINQIAYGKKVSYSGSLSDYSYKKLPAYKTGGLADFTGPAWLDGTKSKPEYILSADQTKAFFTLVDVLSGLRNTSQESTQKTGDINYDIDINVERIESDYDVEQMAGKIKSLINEDARYRNNNAINLMR